MILLLCIKATCFKYVNTKNDRKIAVTRNRSSQNCTSHKFILFAIVVPKIFTVGGNLTKF